MKKEDKKMTNESIASLLGKKKLENRTGSFHTIFDSLCQLDLQLFLCIYSQRYSIEVYTD